MGIYHNIINHSKEVYQISIENGEKWNRETLIDRIALTNAEFMNLNEIERINLIDFDKRKTHTTL